MASESPWCMFSLDGSSKVKMIQGMGMDGPLRKDSDCCKRVLVCFLYLSPCWCQRFLGSFLEFARLKAMTTSRSCTESG